MNFIGTDNRKSVENTRTCILKLFCMGNNDATANMAWATKLSQVWDPRHSRADPCNSIETCFQVTQRSKSSDKFKHSWDRRNRVIREGELCSCRCSTTLNSGLKTISEHVPQTQQRLPNTRSNPSLVTGVSVDLDEQYGIAHARTNQTERGITLPGK